MTWANGLTEAQIAAALDDVGKEAQKIIDIANVLLKLKQAQATRLAHVVLSADEIASLMTMLRTLQSDNRKT